MANSGRDDLRQTPRSELARALLALADPIRLRMLNLMFVGALSPGQFAVSLGVAENVISKHLVYFRETKIVATWTRGNTKYYTVRKETQCPYFRLLTLAIEFLQTDSALSTDAAIFNSLNVEGPYIRDGKQTVQPDDTKTLSTGRRKSSGPGRRVA